MSRRKAKFKIECLEVRWKLFAFIAKIYLKLAEFHNNRLHKLCARNQHYINKMSDTNNKMTGVLREFREEIKI